MKRTVIGILFICIATLIQAQSIRKVKMDEVVNRFSATSDTVYVVNFWATFCKPCVAELPDFIRITKQYADKKVKLIMVSLDLPSYYPTKISTFAKSHKFNAEILWLNETNADHFCPMIDPKWSGAIPATIIVNNNTGYRKFTEDQINAVDFEKALKEAMGK